MSRLNHALGVALMLPLAAPVVAKNAPQPNILIIFTDDQGYGDLSCMGSQTTKTLVFDKLAEEGTVFTNCYAQHVSGASRSSLLTGRYPLRSGGFDMPADEVTFAEMAKTVGYQTACIGKWDVSNRKPIEGRVPNDQGFDYYYGTLGANDGGKAQMYDNYEEDVLIKDMSKFTKLYTNKAIDYLENKREDNKPFILYVAHTMLHSRVGVSPEFKGTSDRSLYGDALQELDSETGRLLETLDKLGLRENTIIIYMTDNGPWSQPKYINNTKKYYAEGEIFWGEPGGLRDGKGSAYEGGAKTPCIINWAGHVPAGVRKSGLLATIDFMPTFASLCGFSVPSDRIIDGVDQSKMFFTKSDKSARETYAYMQVRIPGQNLIEDFAAVRDQKWKLLVPDRKVENHRFLEDFGTNDYELYDLINDPAESVNLIDKYPKEAERLKKIYNDFRESFIAERQ